MSLPAAARIGRVGLAVADPDRVASFYEAVAGLERIDASALLALGVDGRPLIALRPAPDAGPRPADAAGLFHLALRYPTRPALAAALARLRKHRALDGGSDHLVSEALYATDPEDNGVELYRDRPREEWPRTDDGGVGIDTLPLDLDDLAAAVDGESAASGTDGAISAPRGTDVGHVHLEVTDLGVARQFYVDALGFEEMARYEGGLFVGAGGYHHHLGLNVWNGRSAPATGRGLDWFEVVFPGREACDAAVDRLTAAGYDLDAADSGAGVDGDAMVARDPDGIAVRLVVD